MAFNISEAANLAIHALTYLANQKQEGPVSTGQVAQYLGASENHLSKVFQRLNKARLVRSIRGPRGGFFLTRDPEKIALKEIYEAIDGPLQLHSCLLGHAECDRSTCVFGEMLSGINEQVNNTTLADLIEG